MGGEIHRTVSWKKGLAGPVVKLNTNQGNFGFGVHESATTVGRTCRFKSAFGVVCCVHVSLE